MSEVQAADSAHNTCILPCDHVMNAHKSSNVRQSQSIGCDMQVGVTLRAVSSWKWVAKRVVQPIDSIRCSDMAQASPKPS